MLESIYIENFAIIDRLEINFKDQMTVLTGETGAGKSIIIDAIGQLMGNRSQTSFIKNDCNEAFIEGVFTIKDNSTVFDKLKEYRISYDDKLIVSKSFNRDNKTTIKINYRNVSKTVLHSIMSELIDIHSQFETHQLFDANNHIIILDNFIGNKILSLKQQYSHSFNEYKKIYRDYQNTINEELSDEQLEYYQAQLEEINSLDLSSINEEELEQEKKQLQNYEKTSQIITNYHQYISSSNGAIALLNNAVNELELLNDDPQYASLYDKINDLYYNLLDLDNEIMTEFNHSDFDEYRLNEIQEILFKLNRLKRKYGFSIEAILTSKNELENKIAAFNNRETYLLELKNKLDLALNNTNKLAKQITLVRKEAALQFTKKVTAELKSLYLEKVIFEINFEKTELNTNGQDKITFLVATNIGQTLKPLNKVASGGELSRIMLAIKILSLDTSSVETIIFDEADTGVSGKVAESIGAKMQLISETYQVLCITHLAQVAGFAKNHYLICKKSNETDTRVNVDDLTFEQSINEIAKLISGKDVSKESIEHAKKLKINYE